MFFFGAGRIARADTMMLKAVEMDRRT